jgi:hypothetical protein
MNAVTLTGNANKRDAGNFNANLFEYILFIANKVGTDTIWSEADGKLKAGRRKQNKLKFQSMTQSTIQPSDRIKVLKSCQLPVENPPTSQVEYAL